VCQSETPLTEPGPAAAAAESVVQNARHRLGQPGHARGGQGVVRLVGCHPLAYSTLGATHIRMLLNVRRFNFKVPRQELPRQELPQQGALDLRPFTQILHLDVYVKRYVSRTTRALERGGMGGSATPLRLAASISPLPPAPADGWRNESCRCLQCDEVYACSAEELCRAVSRAPLGKLLGLRIMEDRSSRFYHRCRPPVHPGPADLLRMPMPKLTYIHLPPYWELNEELVQLMDENMPELMAISVIPAPTYHHILI
jgi:hypothetical protein